MGEKSAWGRVRCVLRSNLGKNQCFDLTFHTVVPLRAFATRRLDTGVSGLQLVALERLLSIEDAVEIQVDVTFLRGRL